MKEKLIYIVIAVILLPIAIILGYQGNKHLSDEVTEKEYSILYKNKDKNPEINKEISFSLSDNKISFKEYIKIDRLISKQNKKDNENIHKLNEGVHKEKLLKEIT